MHGRIVNLYVGFDQREEIGYHVFCSSVIHNSSVPVRITPLDQSMLRGIYGERHTDGSNAFTYLRFLIPWLQDWKGWALFCDGADMVCVGDIAELWAMRDEYCAVQVAKHDYKTKAPRKYIGTPMECANPDYPRKNWSSVALINCAHFAWRDLTPDTVAEMSGQELHRYGFVPEEKIGEIPLDWNWLPQEYGPARAKLFHYTLGIPHFKHYKNDPCTPYWFDARDRMLA